MELWSWAIISILIAVIIAMAGKIYLLRKSAREIAEAFRDRLMTDTNTLIDISSGDREMRRLASEINGELRRLRAERLRYQNGDRELKEAVTGISHDLRTPLTAISGYLDLLDGEDKSENAARYIGEIRGRAESMRMLTEELFRYSVITSESELKFENIDLRGLLEETLISFYGELQKRGITPEINLPDAPVIRSLDRMAASRIIENIVGNAVKYSDGDLAVTLTEEGEMRFSNSAHALSEVDVGRLFDRFFTVNTARGSTGLGLSVAKHLTVRMGGDISAGLLGGVLTITVSF